MLELLAWLQGLPVGTSNRCYATHEEQGVHYGSVLFENHGIWECTVFRAVNGTSLPGLASRPRSSLSELIAALQQKSGNLGIVDPRRGDIGGEAR